MPTYEYECKSCDNRFDVFQGMNAEHIKVCPKCKGKVRRLIGAGAGIIFKGTGFYATDYRKTKPPEPASCPMKSGDGDCKSCKQQK